MSPIYIYAYSTTFLEREILLEREFTKFLEGESLSKLSLFSLSYLFFLGVRLFALIWTSRWELLAFSLFFCVLESIALSFFKPFLRVCFCLDFYFLVGFGHLYLFLLHLRFLMGLKLLSFFVSLILHGEKIWFHFCSCFNLNLLFHMSVRFQIYRIIMWNGVLVFMI